MTSPEFPAILYEHADGRRAVVSANRVATFAIDNPDWHRAGPVEIIWVDEPTGWRPIEAMRESDADEVLVWKPGIGLLVVIWLEDDHPDAEEGAGWHEAWSHKRIYGITHGMPAPLPPSPSSADEGGSNG